MYSSKRLAKRSIKGTRVAAPWPDGFYYPGIIASVAENASGYTVCFFNSCGRAYKDTEIVGPGFQGIANVHLKFGQKVFFTNNGREMTGCVQKHRKPTNEVFIKMDDGSETVIQRKLDEVRLLESRKSPRLADHETNYLKLADMNPSSDAKRRAMSHCIDVPSAKSPKVEEEPLMDDVMAAMVLTSLSGSSPMATDNSTAPYSPASLTGATTTDSLLGNASSYSPSSSGHFSWPDFHSRGTPSPTSSTSDIESNGAYGLSCPEIGATNGFVFGPPSIDEGIDMSEVGALCTVGNNPVQKPKIGPVWTVYKCTWPGCSKTSQTERDIVKHVRSQHLRMKKDPNSNDHEEEFYYTEIEMSSVDTMSDMFANMNTSTSPTLHHLGTISSPHENSETMQNGSIVAPMSECVATSAIPTSKIQQTQMIFTFQTAHPTTFTPSQTSGQLSSLSRTKTNIVQQRHQLHQAASPKTNLYFSSPGGPSSSNHHHHHHHHPPKTREGKKCRKQYGMERKDLWCTQCRWKKACVRFVTKTPEEMRHNRALWN